MLRLVKIIFIGYVSICLLLYFFQEKLIFHPQKLAPGFAFQFENKFEEVFIKTGSGNKIHGLFFHCDNPKGLIFYLHGNAGSLANWGNVAPTYIALGYDVFIPDYPGYGKSHGTISNEQELIADLQSVYDTTRKNYSEDRIIILGYSIGTGPAAALASTNHPRLLILQAPYYNLPDLVHHSYPVLPTFILRYKFQINEFLKTCKCPVVIFHGTDDEVIYFESSARLKKEMGDKITLIPLPGQAHNGMTDNPDYRILLRKLLSE